MLSRKSNWQKLSEVGDTLVEVMLAIAIVASVLGAAYATASRALRTGRFAQERSEALRYVESQIERLKFSAKGKTLGTAPFYTTDDKFCITEANTFVVGASPSCRFGGLYDISVVYKKAEPGQPKDINPDDKFTVTAEWEKIGGGSNLGKDTMEVVYKMHPGVD